MQQAEIATRPEGPALTKPAYGAPCNGCGFCCQEEVCAIGLTAMPEAVAPCPFLRFNGARHRCSLVEMEAACSMKPLIAKALGIGWGCCSSDPEATP